MLDYFRVTYLHLDQLSDTSISLYFSLTRRLPNIAQLLCSGCKATVLNSAVFLELKCSRGQSCGVSGGET